MPVVRNLLQFAEGAWLCRLFAVELHQSLHFWLGHPDLQQVIVLDVLELCRGVDLQTVNKHVEVVLQVGSSQQLT